MFQSARIKLTIWYTLIIMLISLSFSLAIYKVLGSELDRLDRTQRLRIERGLPERPFLTPSTDLDQRIPRRFFLDPELLKETRERLGLILALINLVILAISAASGYFLSGRTLKPIKEMVEEQNRFITDASHELRTPLTTLKTEIEVNLRNKKLSVEEAKAILKSNLEEVNNLQVLSDDLIKLTRYQPEKNVLTLVEVTSKQLFDEAVKKIVNQSEAKKIKINTIGEELKFEGNRKTLVELLIILLDNAIKYSPGQSEIKLEAEKVDGSIFLHVSDQGVGIEEKDLPHIFDRFYRADRSRTKIEVSGYGLGLSIARKIAERHGGSIRVKSKINSGSVFTVELPLKSPNKLI